MCSGAASWPSRIVKPCRTKRFSQPVIMQIFVRSRSGLRIHRRTRRYSDYDESLCTQAKRQNHRNRQSSAKPVFRWFCADSVHTGKARKRLCHKHLKAHLKSILCSFCAEKHYFKRMSVIFPHPAFWIKKKKALIDKAFLMVAAIGFEPMTLRVWSGLCPLREGLLHNKKRETQLRFMPQLSSVSPSLRNSPFNFQTSLKQL